MNLRNVSAIKSFTIFATTCHVTSWGKNCEAFVIIAFFIELFCFSLILVKKKWKKVSLILVKWNKVKSKILVKWDIVGNRESEKGGQSTLQENTG